MTETSCCVVTEQPVGQGELLPGTIAPAAPGPGAPGGGTGGDGSRTRAAPVLCRSFPGPGATRGQWRYVPQRERLGAGRDQGLPEGQPGMRRGCSSIRRAVSTRASVFPICVYIKFSNFSARFKLCGWVRRRGRYLQRPCGIQDIAALPAAVQSHRSNTKRKGSAPHEPPFIPC